MNTSSSPKTAFIMPDSDVYINATYDPLTITIDQVATEIHNGSQVSITARYGDGTIASNVNWYVDRCGTIVNNGTSALFTATEAGYVTITATAPSGKQASCNTLIIDRTFVNISNNASGATVSNHNPWKGETITINAGSKSGYKFAGWSMGPGDGRFGNPSAIQTTFTVDRTGSIALITNWIEERPYYAVNMGSNIQSVQLVGRGNYHEGDTVTIGVYDPDGGRFTGWECDSSLVKFTNPKSPSTTFIMPATSVYIYPTFA